MLKNDKIDESRKKKVLVILADELARAESMVNDLLDAFSKQGLEYLPMIMKKCDLKKITGKCIDNIQFLHQDKINIVFKSKGDLTGRWSKDGLLRIIENLVNNSIKYGETGEVITITLQDKEDEVILIVHNFGNPIPRKEHKKIFNAFHRTDSALKSDVSGWGLGLSLVHDIVKRHQGSIKVKSSATEGTSFIVTLPKNSV